ncbi:hypothetical protein LINPERHAP2_LOCUS35309, partial [Linum perenne]
CGLGCQEFLLSISIRAFIHELETRLERPSESITQLLKALGEIFLTYAWKSIFQNHCYQNID